MVVVGCLSSRVRVLMRCLGHLKKSTRSHEVWNCFEKPDSINVNATGFGGSGKEHSYDQAQKIPVVFARGAVALLEKDVNKSLPPHPEDR
ncbi:hypothetical protein RHGRI_002428 [Rhododendron griersonianum]|uniref:Uncharacterized protein n=1 Tax=Rhododendron griersonianum TaxID=479676 RepID=A0AAV6LS21_9ERIC|nr:hypothetical protein RHGRI_002428 [Rhododendron griersonianum]